MGIRVSCPKCSKRLNVKSFLAGKRGVCPDCGTRFEIPAIAEPEAVPETEEVELPVLDEAPPPVGLPDPLAPPLAASFPSAPFPTLASSTEYETPPQAPLPALIVPPSDVFAQAPQAFWHLCTAAGERQGPLPGEILRQWVLERRIAPDSLVWRDGWTDWQRADVVFTELGIPPAILREVPAATSLTASPEITVPLLSAPVQTVARRTAGHRAKNSQMLVAIVLILCLLALVPVLGYVLMRQL